MAKNDVLSSKYDHDLCENYAKENLLEIQNKLNKQNFKKNNLFSILLPPPNVTGKLHIGHAWNVTIQDCLIRFNTLNNNPSYWICGMDHAGIATQSKFESQLEQKDKNELKGLSRFEKIEKVHKWSQNNAETIRQQWKKMGLFLDYENELFTLQKESNDIVNQTFVKLYENNLIYRAKKLVNWDFKLNTAISNIEVIKTKTKSKMFYIKYFLENSNEYLTVATTRPETIFVDECLIVNPKDTRYKKYVNKFVVNPLTNKLLKVIVDEYVDKNFGTGIMKCTPAHDFNDYDLGLKHNLKIISCFDKNGKTNENALDFKNLTINECRQKVVDFLEKNNFLVDIKIVESNIGYSERSGAVVEPMLSDQWFLKMKEYANKIIDLQKTKHKVKFYPLKFEKMLINWLKNINDWCISRQLWWGHQIPAWYHKKTNEVYVGLTPPKNLEEYNRDEDVLDTWFSSGLWPITAAKSLKNSLIFPTNVLVTAYDIIFFWVSRMMFFSLFLENKMPFNHVYITGLIRDENNKKMSKSLGNGIDPNDVIKEYGVDTLRLLLLSSSSPGQDLIYSEKKLKNCWGFINKIWNCFRFLNQSTDFLFDIKQIHSDLNDFDHYMINKLNKVISSYNVQMKKYNFLVAIKKLIDFSWNDFCNSYIDLNKFRNKQKNFLWTSHFIFLNILILLHPIIPFASNKIYDLLNFKQKKESILFESVNSNLKIKKDIKNEIDNLLLIINKIRTYIFDNKINKFEKIEICLLDNKNDFLKLTNESINLLENNKFFIKNIKNLQNPDFVESNFLIFIVNKNEISLLNKTNKTNLEWINLEIEKMEKEIQRCDKMLNNENFLKKAPQSKIEEEKQKRKNYFLKLENLKNMK